MSNAGRDALVAMLSRLKSDLSSLNLAKPDDARLSLQAKYPLNGDFLLEVKRLCQRGLDDGWIGTNPEDAGRHLSLTQPTKYFPFAVEALHLKGDAQGHGHPKGEVSLAWALEGGSPTFCGVEQGWAVFAPGSRHVPRVKGGRMLVLHFLPEGKIDWDDVRASARSARTPRRTATATQPGAARGRKPEGRNVNASSGR